jgi:opacity protein-like surface antigen
MKCLSFLTAHAAACLALWLAPAPLHAQFVDEEKRFEVTPFAGYQWGGSFDTQGSGSLPAGKLQLKDSFAWGAVLSFLAYGNSAVELTYLRQDTDIEFDPDGSAGSTNLGGFAVNYVQLGVRQHLGRGGPVTPFVTVSLGVGIMDPKQDGLESATKFSWSLGGGAQYMFASGRAGIRSDIKLWETPVSSGTYSTWCDFYGCFTSEGTAWVTQGQVSGALVLAF